MPLCYIPCVPGNALVLLPEHIARIWHPHPRAVSAPSVLIYHSDAYRALPSTSSWYDDTLGKWESPYLFIPPLALFARLEDASDMLLIHQEFLRVASN
jgi:hypothetical protein